MGIKPRPIKGVTMRQVDLGDIHGQILIFGGAYSNLQATQALIDAAQEHGIPAERCIFTGDSIAYCGNPSETLNLLRDFGCPMIKGNCEIELAAAVTPVGAGLRRAAPVICCLGAGMLLQIKRSAQINVNLLGRYLIISFLCMMESVMSFCMGVSVMFPSFYSQLRLIKNI